MGSLSLSGNSLPSMEESVTIEGEEVEGEMIDLLAGGVTMFGSGLCSNWRSIADPRITGVDWARGEN